MEQVYLRRINNFYEQMKKHDLDASLITSKENVYYLTGFYTEPHERFMGLFLIKDKEPVLIVPELDANEAKAKSVTKDAYGYLDSEGPDRLLHKLNLDNRLRLGIEENQLSYQKYKWLSGMFSSNTFSDLEPIINGLRNIKDDLELKFLQEAADWADEAVRIGIDSLQIGKSELEIVAEIEYRMKKQGISRMSFETMVLVGEKTASPHGRPANNRINAGDFVLFDLGVVVNGYCSDISRTVVVGKANEKQREIYNTVQIAQSMAIEMVKPGEQIKNIDLTARNHITSKGYGEYFIHRIGHGLGLNVHESPSIHEKNEDLLQEGMVFTIEPGIYVPKIGGVRIEDDVFVIKDGVEVLTNFSKELLEL